MRCGVCLSAMNYTAWPAFDETNASGTWSEPPIPDHRILQEDIEIGLAADALGFDALWTVEHRATPYNMVTNPLQWLTYFAGATRNLDFGTMVVVLPWHHPVRVAEDIAMLHNILGEHRTLTVGVGRGAARREFAALNIAMDESRERFLEVLAVLRGLLGEERFAFEGRHYTVPPMSIRPRPRDSDALLDRMYCAWGSAQSIPIAAEAGLKPLVIPLKSWDDYAQDLGEFSALRAAKGFEPVRPIVAVSLYCAETEQQASDGARQYFGDYTDAAIRSYELNSSHFAQTRGYEAYAESGAAEISRAELHQGMTKTWIDNHVWGTPDMCVERIRTIANLLSPSELIVLARIGSMPLDVAMASLELFAAEVLPAVREI